MQAIQLNVAPTSPSWLLSQERKALLMVKVATHLQQVQVSDRHSDLGQL